IELRYKEHSRQHTEEDAGEQKIVKTGKSFCGKYTFRKSCDSLKVFYCKLDFQNIYYGSHKKLKEHAEDGSACDSRTVFRIFYKTACDIYTDRNGKEFLQLSKPSELSQHDLAEYKFSGCGAKACGERIKEH